MTCNRSRATNNRRNLYRVLHVQLDAPLEVIRSSWRTLLGRLRQHPDLGGTHAQAVLINQAWGDEARALRPLQAAAMLPYLATIAVLVLISRNPVWIRVNVNRPASLGKPFHPGG